jgi:hypothetical protein
MAQQRHSQISANTDKPIFIHSLFRAGSTYLFNVFRRSKELYWCYQEPLHELAVVARDAPHLLLELAGVEQSSNYRHSSLVKPYFQELYDVWPCWKDEISKSAIFDAYFAPEGMDIGISYWRALADAAKGRPVFQECRTASRIAAIKEKIGGYHIYLWRNPWDQWWSYKVTEYFDDTNQLIINAPNAPAAVQALRSDLGFNPYSSSNIAEELAHFSARPLSAEESYLVFYMLWCLGLQEGATHAHLMLNIDRLSDSLAYRGEAQAKLIDAGISGIDFSDCRVPQGRYLKNDQAFFGALEERVHQWLNEGGWTQKDIKKIQMLRQRFQPFSWKTPIPDLAPPELAEQASRARDLVRRFETNLAEHMQNDARKLSEVEGQAKAIEAKVQQTEAESRAQVAEAKVQQTEAESRAQVAEAKVQQTEAESRAQVAEAKVQQAEAATRAAEAALQVQQAEAKTREAEAALQVQQAEAKTREAEAALQVQQAEAATRAAEVARLSIDLETKQRELDGVHQANHHHWQLSQELAEQVETTRKELHEVHQANHHHWLLAEARDRQIRALQTSRSWKITAPMRWIADFILRRGGTSAVPPAPTFPDRLIRWGMARPRLVALLKVCLKTVPPLHQKLGQRVKLAMNPALAVSPDPSPLPAVSAHKLETLPPENLSPHARQIYADLKSAIERRQREQA